MPVKKIKDQRSKIKTTTKVTTKKSVIANEVKQSGSDNDSTQIVSSHVNLSVPVYSLTGEAAGTLSLPKEIFGQKVNKKLLAQAMRVYTTNQKTLPGSTKTRGEVEGSTVKIYRQKGTGRARHGAIRAPIFAGGGIVFGPKPRKLRLDLPKKMKKAALLSALSAKLLDKNIIGLAGVEKASGKTKEMVQLLTQLKSKIKDQKSKILSTLIVIDGSQNNVVRAVRNIPGVSILPANLINAYEVIKHRMLLISKEAVEKIQVESRVKSLESREETSKEAAVKSKRKGGKS